MNNIQKALLLQDINVAWAGNEPENVNKISKAYLNGKLDSGYARLVRTKDDSGHSIIIKKLKEDYKNILENTIKQARSNLIKKTAKDIILSRYPMYKQNNMITEANMLNAKKTTTSKEKTELKTIQEAWEWIQSVRNVSNVAETSNINVFDILWPE